MTIEELYRKLSAEQEESITSVVPKLYMYQGICDLVQVDPKTPTATDELLDAMHTLWLDTDFQIDDIIAAVIDYTEIFIHITTEEIITAMEDPDFLDMYGSEI